MPPEAPLAIDGAVRGTVTDRRARLQHEALVFTHYLIGSACPDEMVARYVDGVHALFGESEAPDRATAFAAAHAWSLALLDTAGAVTRRAADLRARLQLMAAILEASPVFAERFLD